MKKAWYFLMAGLLVYGCRNREPELLKPESAVTDTEYIYVSNVNGPPTEKDGNGYITKLYRNGKVCTNKFIEGLNAPKGLALVDGVLYVTDIDRVLGFDPEKGSKVFECQVVNKTNFLNDICYDGNGHLYVSAVDINDIFEINISNKSIRLLGLANRLTSPNGLAWNKGTLYVGEFDRDSARGSLKAIDWVADSLLVSTLSNYQGLLDGLCYSNGKLYFSDWVDFDETKEPAKIMTLDLASKQVSELKAPEPMSGCADIFLDEGTQTIIAPLMRENKVIFVPL